MAEEHPQQEADEDPFADSDEWIAAEARQLFRALSADDPKAVEVGLFYLTRPLRGSEPERPSRNQGFCRRGGLRSRSRSGSRLGSMERAMRWIMETVIQVSLLRG